MSCVEKFVFTRPQNQLKQSRGVAARKHAPPLRDPLETDYEFEIYYWEGAGGCWLMRMSVGLEGAPVQIRRPIIMRFLFDG